MKTCMAFFAWLGSLARRAASDRSISDEELDAQVDKTM